MNDMFEEYSKLLDGSEEHLSNETLATYSLMSDQLSSKEKDFIELHLGKCQLCKTKLESLIEENDEIDPGESAGPKIFRLPAFVRYAAAASIIIAVGILYYLIILPQGESESVAISEEVIENGIEMPPIDSIDTAEDMNKELDSKIEQELKSVNKEMYAVNIVLENFIERNVRSEKKLELKSPNNDETVNSPIKFEWTRYNFSGAVKIVIVDNKKVFEKEVPGINYEFDQILPEGLYYWKIFADGRIEDIGKFKIMRSVSD